MSFSNRILILFVLLVYSVEAQQVKASTSLPKVPIKTEGTKSAQEELLTTDASEPWHRGFVKSWNEWVNTQKKTPDFASKEKLLHKLAKDVFTTKRARINAQTNSAIVSFFAKTDAIAENPSTNQQSAHRLTIRILNWPKFLVNGNTFLFNEKTNLEKNYVELKKTHHYKALSEIETKNEFSLAALSYMAAMKDAAVQVKAESRMRMQKPNATQLTNAKKATPDNLTGHPIQQRIEKKLSFWERSKEVFKKLFL